jgi:spore germination protein YaaH
VGQISKGVSAFLAAAVISTCIPTTPGVVSASSTRLVSVKPYKVQITASKLNIRQSASATGKVVGTYVKGIVVDVVGQAGSFLKTSKGYIHASYTKKLNQTTGLTSVTLTKPLATNVSFKPYKVTITASKLSIRKTASTSGKLIGYYYKGNVVDVIGKTGSFLRTSKGYIHVSYTKSYTPPQPKPSIPAPASVVGKYVSIKDDMQLLASLDGVLDERFVLQGETFQILEQKNEHYKIKVGRVYGYIPSSKTTLLSYVPKNKISVLWDYAYKQESNPALYDDPTDYANRRSTSIGLDVLSPTWFDMVWEGNKPKFVEKGDLEYMRLAHQNGYEVWPRFVEMSAERASKWLNDPSARSLIIDQLVMYSALYDLDGINIDFETLGSSNKDAYTSFVKDLSQRLKAEGLTVSLDVMTPRSWNMWYNYSVVKDYVDYVMLMAYDEHYSSSTVPGSVGSYNFVENSIKDTLSQGVSADKLVLCVPFYMRDFAVVDVNEAVDYDRVVFYKDSVLYDSILSIDLVKFADVKQNDSLKSLGTIDAGGKKYHMVEYNGQILYTPSENTVVIKANKTGSTVVGSTAVTMETLKNTLLTYNGSSYVPTYDAIAKQKVAEYIKDGIKHRVWIEDKDSMAWRMDLANKYGLKGAAGWSTITKPTEDIWQVIKSKLK